ncbi:response regulator transcription factor [uncultured Adlercreutzia sp.]|uniref:response regulator transcription factor n=1 Tax=uncultured Adlercreutzia sp. TaxID=875803 RepID=UPI0026765E44|nr:helix-turn-helix transcriptional regulator [uncultured Adlercreutzia sp.]
MYSTRTLFDAPFVIAGLGGGSVAFLYLVSILALSLTCFLAAAFDQRLVRFAHYRAVMTAAAALTGVGTLIAFAPLGNTAATLPFDCCSGILTGIGSAVLLLFWGTSFARADVRTIATCGATAVVGGFALNTLVLQSLPFPIGGIAAALLPVGELVALNRVVSADEARPHRPFNSLPTSKARMALKLFAPMAFAGFTLGILKHISVQTTLGGALTPESCVTLLLAGSLTVSLFVLFPRLYPQGRWDTLLRVVVPLISCVSFLFAMLVFADRMLSDLFLLIAYIFIETVVWVYYAYLAHKMRLSPIFIFGLSRGIITLFMLLGAIAAAWCNPYLEATPVGDVAAILISLVLIALGFALMPRETDILHSIVECPAVRLVSLELEEGLGLLGQSAPAAEDSPSSPQAAPAEGCLPDSEAACEAGRRPTVAQGTSPTAAPTSAARAAMERTPDAAERTGGRFSAKVKKVASLYLLTERETDILFELAKGGSASYIQEKYYISASTVKTHIRNIYRKLDIHKRSDLLRLLEEIDDYE